MNAILEQIEKEKAMFPDRLSDEEEYIKKHSGTEHMGYAHKSDGAMASAVRMLMGNHILHEPIVTAARDRICHLSQRVKDLEAEIARLKSV